MWVSEAERDPGNVGDCVDEIVWVGVGVGEMVKDMVGDIVMVGECESVPEEEWVNVGVRVDVGVRECV